MITPCVKICKLDPKLQCIGCKRTVAEIKIWHKLSDQERLAIMEQLKGR